MGREGRIGSSPTTSLVASRPPSASESANTERCLQLMTYPSPTSQGLLEAGRPGRLPRRRRSSPSASASPRNPDGDSPRYVAAAPR
jgi:hypothetical protein